MVNTIEKHRMLRLDLLEQVTINNDSSKGYYFYSYPQDWPNGFMFADFKTQFILLKDDNQKIIYLYDDFYQRVKLMYSCLELNTEDCYIMNDLESFFKTNKSIKLISTDSPFNPYLFAQQYQFQVIEKPFEISVIEASILNMYRVEKGKNNDN
ncbi:hypothetical protein [Flavobacterium aciduliphilum]|uniref:Uncharacterized protein n=1 Tax=Flavobacterium aciduliphilum TaxID=1101402 RepID=A0A328YI59_9FLAO|nr:hypothetical protein [Flavobacterium aciduliphilum]RAR73721.1 hypothetical protein CLV55_10340 [Flavobacterium aciduliphilum]